MAIAAGIALEISGRGGRRRRVRRAGWSRGPRCATNIRDENPAPPIRSCSPGTARVALGMEAQPLSSFTAREPDLRGAAAGPGRISVSTLLRTTSANKSSLLTTSGASTKVMAEYGRPA